MPDRDNYRNDLSYLGFGLGLRPKHYQTILEQKPKIEWFEVLTENYLVPGGKPLYFLNKICQNYPIVLHGVAMSIGSVDELDMDYLKQVKNLAKNTQAKWISDHLCWTGVDGKNLHDLMPLPYTEEALEHVVRRIDQVQNFFSSQLLIENPSSYLQYKNSTMSEWAFIAEMAERSDCLILLDINNVYVNSVNHNFDPVEYINALPIERVQQIHLAGHLDLGTHIIDTHDQAIIDPVWELYELAVQRFGAVSTMIERDDNIPPLTELQRELAVAKSISDRVLGRAVA